MVNNTVFGRIAVFLFLPHFLFSVPLLAAQEPDIQREYLLTHIVRTEDGPFYALTERRGALISFDRGKNWWKRTDGLPSKQVWPFSGTDIRGFTSLTVDTGNTQRVAATTSTSLYISENSASSWTEIELKYPVKASNYLTAVSFDPSHEDRIYLGSSFNGLFVSEDAGRSWEKLSEHLDPLYRGAGFYEEITDLAMVPGIENELFIGAAFDNLLYRYNTERKVLSAVELPDTAGMLTAINSYSGGAVSPPALELHFEFSRFIYDLKDELWREVPALLKSTSSAEKDRALRVEKEYDNIRGIYLNAYNARGERLDEHLDFLKDHGFNAIVVDVKDDWGRLTYNSRLKMPAEIDAVHPVFDLEELVQKAHEAGIYVIGRMVVFKDKRLYHMDNYKYAVWNSSAGGPWRHKVAEEREKEGGEEGEKETVYVQREFWTDPFSEFVWDYNISIAMELESRGIDEVQFDYIRFPSDGDLRPAVYRFKREGMLRTEAIESFISKARARLKLPISTDLYGFNSWYRMGNWIGQDITMLSRYVDVICPMYYPSHFPGSFLKQEDYIDRAFELYKRGTERARRIAGESSHIRPYVQAFLIGGELSMEEDEYELYLNRQLEGIRDAGGCGYTLWNNSNRYYMVNGKVLQLNAEVLESCSEEKADMQGL